MNTSTNQARHTTYYYLRDNAPKLTAWRTPGRTRALVYAYFGGLIVAILTWLAVFFDLINLWVYLAVYVGALVVAMVAYSMLRMTIDVKDAAPSHELDDYEEEILDSWRVTGHRISQVVLLVGGFFFVLAGAFLTDSFDPGLLLTSAGLYMIFAYLIIGTLPVVGFAATFNKQSLETEEEA